MNKKNLLLSGVLAGMLISGGAVLAQGPAQNVDPNRHPNLAEAQHHILEAFQKVGEAQKMGKDEFGGHADKAKQLLDEADREIKEAAEFYDHNHH